MASSATSLSIRFSQEYVGNYTNFLAVVIISETPPGAIPKFMSAYSTTLENGLWSNFKVSEDFAQGSLGDVPFVAREISHDPANCPVIQELVGGAGHTPTVSVEWPDMYDQSTGTDKTSFSGYEVGDIWKIHYTLQDFDAYMISSIHHERTTDIIYTDATDGSIKFFNLDGTPNEEGQYTEVRIEDVTHSQGDTPSKPTDMDVYNKNIFIAYGPQAEPMKTKYIRTPGGKGTYSLEPLEIRGPKTVNSPEESIDKVVDSNLQYTPEGGTAQSMFIGISVSGKKLYAISKESSEILVSDDIPFEISSICQAWDDDFTDNTTGSRECVYVSSYTSMRIAKVSLEITAEDKLEAIIIQEINLSPEYNTANFPIGALIGDITAYRRNSGLTWPGGVKLIEEDVILVISGFKEVGFAENETQIITGSIRDMETNNSLGGLFYTLVYNDRSIPSNKCTTVNPGHFKHYHSWGEVKSNDRHRLYFDEERLAFRDTKDWDGAFYNYLDFITKSKHPDGTYDGETSTAEVAAFSSSMDWWTSAIGGLLELVLVGTGYAWLFAGGWLLASAGLTLSGLIATTLPVLSRFTLGVAISAIGATKAVSGVILNKYIQALSGTTPGEDTYYPLGLDVGWKGAVSIFLPRLGLTVIDDLDDTDANLWEPYIGVVAHSDIPWVKYGGCAMYQDDYSGVVDLHAIASQAEGSIVQLDSFLYTFNNMEWSEDYFAASGVLAGTAGYGNKQLTQIGPSGIVFNEAANSGEGQYEDGSSNPMDTYWSTMMCLSRLSPQYNLWTGETKMSLSKAMIPLPIDISEEEVVQCAVIDAEFSSEAGLTIPDQITAIETLVTPENIVITNDAICDKLKIGIVTHDDSKDAAELYVFNLAAAENVANIRSDNITKFERVPVLSTVGTIPTPVPESIQNMSSNFGDNATAHSGIHYSVERPLLFPLIGSTTTLGVFSSQRLGYHVYTPSVSTNEDLDGSTPLTSYPIGGKWGQEFYTTFDPGTEVADGYFREGREYKYKIAYLYEGSYISPMGRGAWTYTPTIASTTAGINSLDHIRATIVINKPDPRVTHVLLYRLDPDAEAYAECASIKISRFAELATTGSGAIQLMAQQVDSGTLLGTFASQTGISETMHRPMVYFEQSAVIGGRLYAVNLSSPGNPHDDMSHIICSSKANNFHIFDWANDIAILPNIPTAIAAFNGRIYVWDDVNTYRINPDTLFIEDTYDGVGCFGRNAFVVTEYGMCFADHNNIYLHNGGNPKAIGSPILTSLEASEFVGWQELDKKGIKVGYDATINSYVIFVTHKTGTSSVAVPTEQVITRYHWLESTTIGFENSSWDNTTAEYVINDENAAYGLIRGGSGVSTGNDPNDDLASMSFSDGVTTINPVSIANNVVGMTTVVILDITEYNTLTAGPITISYEFNNSDTRPPAGEGIAYTSAPVTEMVDYFPPILEEGTFIFNRLSGSWTYSERLDENGQPAPLSTIAQGPLGEIYMAEPTAIKCFAQGAGIKNWSWDSKEMDFDLANVNKKFSKIYIRGKNLKETKESFAVYIDAVSVDFAVDVKENVITLQKFDIKKGMTIQVKLINQTGSLEAVSFSARPKKVR